MRYASLPYDECQALEKAHALYFEPRQPETRCELARRVTQQRERQEQSVHRLALAGRGLRDQT